MSAIVVDVHTVWLIYIFEKQGAKYCIELQMAQSQLGL
jgi:hypothetical protein